MRHSVQAFVIFLTTVLVGLSVAALGVVLHRTLGERLEAEKREELTRVVTLMARAAERKVGPEVIVEDFKAWEEVIQPLDDYRLSLISHDGQLVEDSGLPPDRLRSRSDNHLTRPEVIEAVRGGLGVSRRYSATYDREFLYVASRIVFLREPQVPVMIIRLGAPMSLIKNSRAEVLKRYALAAFWVTALAALLAFLATRRLNSQIKELISAMGDLAGGQVARRLVRQPKNELAFLGISFNRLASRLSRQSRDDRSVQGRLLAVLENMDEGVLVTDGDGRVTNSNPALRRLFGLDGAPEGLAGESIRFPEVIEALSRAGRGEMVPPLTVTVPGPPEKFLEVRITPLGDEYQPQGVVAVFHDLTGRQRLYQLRRDIVANVSHELRAPLAALSEAAEILGGKAGEDPELKPVAETLGRHRGRLDELSRDLLELSRLESAKTRRLKSEPLKTAELFAEAAASLGPPEGEGEAGRLRTEVEPGAETVVGDRASLRLALRNLLDNAYKYGTPGTAITLSAKPGPRRSVVLAVANQGPALTPEDRERVFERFYRGEKSRLRFPGGAGLGLAIVKHTAQAHGGLASVESRPGGLTVFSLTLPADPLAEA